MALISLVAKGHYGCCMTDDSARNQGKFIIRMPPGMRQRFAAIAAQNNRSMNSEIVARLEASLERDEAKGLTSDEVISRLEDLVRRIELIEQRS